MTKVRKRVKGSPTRASLRPQRRRGPLTEAEKLIAFRRVTRALPAWYPKEIKRGMTNAELKEALARVLGTGGSCGPGEMDIRQEGSGLRIWASWEPDYSRTQRPIFAGDATMALARHVYGIADPDNRQLSLF
jgi:hypothetical protein